MLRGRGYYSFAGWNVKGLTPLTGWCSLCHQHFCEGYVAHCGWKDHICLEAFIDLLYSNPGKVWDTHAVYRASGVLMAPYDALHANMCHLESDRLRRLSMALLELYESGVFAGLDGRAYGTYEYGDADLDQVLARMKGSRSISHYLSRPLSILFPKADSRDLGAVLHMIIAKFNYDVVYDLLRLDTFLSHVPGNKDNVLNVIIGHLMDASSYCPRLPREIELTPRLRTLAGYSMWSLVSELVICRMQEYVPRAELAWSEVLKAKTERTDTVLVPANHALREQILDTLKVGYVPPDHVVLKKTTLTRKQEIANRKMEQQAANNLKKGVE